MRTTIPLLSKSRFMSGSQCVKRLYLECFDRKSAGETTASLQAIYDAGTRIGEIARERFPGGILIEEEHFHHIEAVEKTLRAMADPNIPAIYEAAFLFDGVRVRADVLVRRKNGWDLIEVKSTGEAKPLHTEDLAIQVYVLTGAGLHIEHAYLMHVNKSYVYGGGDYDLEQLFALTDLTTATASRQPDLAGEVSGMRNILAHTEPPAIATGPHCTSPYECPFVAHCHVEVLDHPVGELPGLREKLSAALGEHKIESITAIPRDFPGLNELQQRVVGVVKSQRPYFGESLPVALSTIRYPAHFVDFEAFSTALPIFPGTRPFEVLPFQWSNHIVYANGDSRHEAFLHEGNVDPRLEFVDKLIRTTQGAESIIVYSAYEATRLQELARRYPARALELESVISRIVDLLPILREHVYHPAFHGSFSIKAVLPALVPELGYGDLEIQDGNTAALTFAEIAAPQTSAVRREKLRTDLLKYCYRDTEAMVRLFQMLQSVPTG